jgi:hopanoid biosynthesis associated radical SAM protein HpnH
MRFPLRLNYDLTRYIIKNKINKIDKFPLVLMLEPTHLCNLACSGCGRIREYADTMQDMMSLEECLRSVDECPAPVVTITGGEPFLYPPVYELIEKVLKRGKHIYLCTNGLLLEKALDSMKPHPNLTLNVHMDGMEETHDRILERKGTFKTAIAGIRKAKSLGFRVCTNTTIFKETDLVEIDMLFSHLTDLGVDGILVAPGFGHYTTYREMMEKTDWSRYGVGKDERCAQCMMHCGFEPTVVSEIGKSWKDIWEMVLWNLT